MFRMDLKTTAMEVKLDKLMRMPKDIIPPTYQYFRDITPVDTGNAKRNTVLRGNTIVANYPYAQVLDNGRVFSNGKMQGSKQAPNGMSQPTKQYFMKQLAKNLANAIMSYKG